MSLTMIIGKIVPLPHEKYVVAMSFDHNGIEGVKSVDYTLNFIKPLMKNSEKAEDGFYADFEFVKHEKLDDIGKVGIHLEDGEIIRSSFGLKEEQQLIQIQTTPNVDEIQPKQTAKNKSKTLWPPSMT